MPNYPDVPCAGTCGRLLWTATKSLPPGERMCQACRGERRAANAEAAPTSQAPVKPPPNTPPEERTMSVEMGTPFKSLAAGAGMDLEEVRELAEAGNLEVAVRRYQERQGAPGAKRMTGRQAAVMLRRRTAATGYQRQVELLLRRAA